jgi:hypothetical protein
MEINHATAPHLGINSIAHKSRVRSDYDKTFDTSNQQTNHRAETSQQVFTTELIKIIRDIRKEEIPAPTPPKFIFDMTEEAAENPPDNAKMRRNVGGDASRHNRLTAFTQFN